MELSHNEYPYCVHLVDSPHCQTLLCKFDFQCNELGHNSGRVANFALHQLTKARTTN